MNSTDDKRPTLGSELLGVVESEGLTVGAAELAPEDGRGPLAKVTGGRSAYPLVVLSAFFLVDQIDTQAFGILLPEIQATFNLSTTTISLILALNFLVLLGGSVFIGFLADRSSRIRLTILLAILAVVGSIFTGLSPAIWVLVVARIVNGVGVAASNPVHRSLLADYYEAKDRGNLFAFHQSADQVANVVAPLVVALLGTIFGWRLVFIILAVPIAVIVVFALRLRDPLRGGTDDAETAAAAAQEPPQDFGEAIRTLGRSRTLRRTWAALVFVGAGFLPIATFVPLFYRTVFGLSLAQRGVLGAISSLFGIVGLLVAGAWVQRVLPVDAARVQRASGHAFIGVAVCVVGFAASPSLWFSFVSICLLGLVSGFYVPASAAVQALVAPARLRTQAFAFGALFLASGAFLAPIAGSIADSQGLRLGLLAFTPFLVIGGIVMVSAGRFVEEDRAAAQRSLETAASLRAQRESGEISSLLVCRGLDVHYGTVQVLFDVDFEVRQGEIIALLGTNGAGKSTLLRAISGLTPPTNGFVFIDGQDVSSKAPWDTAAAGVVLMPGGKSVFPLMTVEDNLKMATWLNRRDPDFIRERMAEVRHLFPRLEERWTTPAGNLSGGEQQMLSLAQSLINKPKLLMIDELSLGLAPKVVGELLEIVREIHRTGVTIVLVEQSVNIALTIADRAYFMEKGQVRFSGATADLLGRDDILRSVFLEGAASAESLLNPTS